MKSKIKSALLLVCAGIAVVLIPVFLSKDTPIEVSVTERTKTKLAEQEAEQQQEAQAQAAKNRTRRVYRCQVDEDCIIVDKDPCGCLVGPSGVTAINAAYTLDFNRMNVRSLTKACPETAPSMERECSPSAHAVCAEQVCKIAY